MVQSGCWRPDGLLRSASAHRHCLLTIYGRLSFVWGNCSLISFSFECFRFKCLFPTLNLELVLHSPPGDHVSLSALCCFPLLSLALLFSLSIRIRQPEMSAYLFLLNQICVWWIRKIWYCTGANHNAKKITMRSPVPSCLQPHTPVCEAAIAISLPYTRQPILCTECLHPSLACCISFYIPYLLLHWSYP